MAQKKRASLFEKKGGGNAVEVFRGADPDLILKTIEAVIAAGKGITFAGTRRGDAVSLCFLDDGDQDKTYPATAEELTEALGLVTDACEVAEATKG